MWTLKLKVKEEWSIYSFAANKYKIKIYLLSQNYFLKNKKYYFTGSGIIEGSEDKINLVMNHFKTNKIVDFFEHNKDFFILRYFEPLKSKRVKGVICAYNPALIQIKPAIVNENGEEEWEVASFLRKDLEKFLTAAQNNPNTKIYSFSIKKMKPKSFLISSMFPKLTNKQETALKIAIQNNYFDTPRRITIKDLSQLMNLSPSTYQFHLAKAEGKLMPFFEKRIRYS